MTDHLQPAFRALADPFAIDPLASKVPIGGRLIGTVEPDPVWFNGCIHADAFTDY